MTLTIASLTELLLDKVSVASYEAEYQSYKLILVVASQRNLKEIEEELANNRIEVNNLSKHLSRRLIGLSVAERKSCVLSELKDIIKGFTHPVWLTKLNILFEPSLENDPINLLKNASRAHVLVAIWPGDMTEKSLVYAKPGHPDYKCYILSELNDIQIIDIRNGVIQ